MRANTLGALILLAIISLGAAVYAVTQSADDPRFDKVGVSVFPGLVDKVNDISELTVESAKGRITAYREGKLWRVRESDNHLASPNEVYKAIVGVSELAYFEPKTVRKDQFKKLQLDDTGVAGSESKRVILKVGDQTVADLIVGREKLFLPGLTTGGVYFRLSGSEDSWLGRGNPEAGPDPKDWLAREIVDIDGKRVQRVSVRHTSGEIVTVSKTTPLAESFTLAGIPKGMRLRYDSDAEHIGGILAQLEMNDARASSNVTIDWTNAVVAKVETFDGIRAVLETVDKAGTYWLRISFEGVGTDAQTEAAELTQRTRNWVYEMPKYEVVPILRGMKDLLVPEQSS